MVTMVLHSRGCPRASTVPLRKPRHARTSRRREREVIATLIHATVFGARNTQIRQTCGFPLAQTSVLLRFGMMSSGSSAFPEHSPKRRRISQSCSACRQKKTRCDGQQPTCSSCRTKGLDCEYDKDSIVAISSSTLANIEARLSKLEELTSGRSDGGVYRPLPPNAQDEDAVGDIVDTTHTIPTFPAPSRTSVLPKISTGTFPGLAEADKDHLKLPERLDSDGLLEAYIRQVYPLFPFLHLPTLRVDYERLWQSPQAGKVSLTSSDDMMRYATLNMVFALGRLNSTSNEPRLSQEQATTFYERARCVLTLDAIDDPSLETVQYCLLTTSYLLFTPRVNRCHMAIGLAIRAAQSIGLDTTAETDPDRCKREMARRVWHSCILYERFESIAP